MPVNYRISRQYDYDARHWKFERMLPRRQFSYQNKRHWLYWGCVAVCIALALSPLWAR